MNSCDSTPDVESVGSYDNHLWMQLKMWHFDCTELELNICPLSKSNQTLCSGYSARKVKLKCKVCIRAKWPIRPELFPVSVAKRLGVFLLPPG